MANTASERSRQGAGHAGAWVAIGPCAVLASWLALVFVPAAFRLAALYGCIAALSVTAFAVAFYLASHDDRDLPLNRPSSSEDVPDPSPPKSGGRSATDDPTRSDGAGNDMIDQGDTSFRLVLEAAPSAMIATDAGGTIQLLNSQAAQLFGYERAELVGQSIEVLVPQSLRATHRAMRGAYMRAPQARRMGSGRELSGLRRDGVEVPVEIGLSTIATRAGHLVLASLIDITERKRAEQALRASEERFRLLVETAPNALIVVDRAGNIVLLNAVAERLFDYERAELIGKPIETLVPHRHAAGHAQLRDGYLGAPSARRAGLGRDLYGMRRDGSEVAIEIGLNPIRTVQGEFVLASVVDITERKRAHEHLGAALAEKTLLLNEIHHRVKNNLQVIASLLSLQAARARDPAVQALISESVDRVQAMALIHQLLFERRDWSSVQLGPYLSRLSELLASTYGRSRIELQVDADEIELDVQRAVPCGLLVNELVTNAFKHAFPDERSGCIRIELRREAAAQARLRVSDTGRGLPEDLDIEHIESLGMQLIPLLAEQVGGTLRMERGPGAGFELRFPVASVGAGAPSQNSLQQCS
ncbi:MAG: PAS domain S-box protein [Burkholderiales bacterium]|nr:PAS domain S-box protein [Burkholderiales bacterium]